MPTELDCWSHTAESLRTLASKYGRPATIETIERVNRLISTWPTDDALPAGGIEEVKAIQRKLAPGISEIKNSTDEEMK